MARKFKQKIKDIYHDLDDLCEKSCYEAAPLSTICAKSTVTFQKAGSDTTNITLDGYKVLDNGSYISCTAVKKGFFPTTESNFCNITVAGSYNITRTDTSLTIGSTTFGTSSFRNGVIPSEIIILLVGGGGGAGGNGYYQYEKKKYAPVWGGAGGGAGALVVRLNLTQFSKLQLRVGAGGKAGTNGSSSGVSSGTAGTDGDGTYLITGGSIYDDPIAGAWGGEGGTGGVGGEKSYTCGTGGNGGTTDVINYVSYYKGVSGGNGNYYGNVSRTKCSGLSWCPTTNTGATTYQFFSEKSNNSSDENLSTMTVGTSAYFSGGCSYSYGDFYSGSASNTGNGGYGGGGRGGASVSNGKAGAAFFYY